MTVFSTEFPVKRDISRADFAAAILAWIRGIQNSNVLAETSSQEFHDDDVWLETKNGETLSIKSYEADNILVFGARLEIPDNAGRRWRTECVYSVLNESAFLRVRGQCVATSSTAHVLPPKKPVFITQSIDSSWAENDGNVPTKSTAHFLNEDDVLCASGIFEGSQSVFLPIIYISRNNDDTLPINADRLASAVAGIAHVFVEPSRGFSFRLREALSGNNPYGGAVGIISPKGVQIARLFPRPDDSEGLSLASDCTTRVSEFMSGFAVSQGWEWQHLQEAQTRSLREKLLSPNDQSKELEEYIELFDAEVDAKDEQIQNLKNQLEIARSQAQTTPIDTDQLIPSRLSQTIGTELYEGEFSDRLRRFLSFAIAKNCEGLDRRTEEFIGKFLQKTSYSGRVITLIQQIKTASRDGKQVPKQLGGLLQGFGFSKSQDGKHLKFSPPSELFGIGQEMLPSTPSDSQRGGKNRGAEIIRAWGLSDLNER